MPITIDVAPYDPFINVAKGIIVIFFTLHMASGVWAALEKS